VLSIAARCVRYTAVCCVLFAVALFTTATTRADETESGEVAEAQVGTHVADLAQGQVGARYRWGGMSPAGFDCTGFVKWVYGQFGVDLPRNEAGQLASGPRVGADDLQPGDLLVFANTYRRGLSHVGIYVGEGRFVHAANERAGVTVSELWDGYWGPRFVGASRALA
jgi:cell wall-associated NlpC family hydrolase